MLRRGSWKYVLAPRPELYDLAADPHEQRNLADEQPARAAALRDDAGEDARPGTPHRARRHGPDACRPICSSGSAPSATSAAATRRRPRRSGADPKDKILEFRRANQAMRDGILALNRREYAAAARAFEELIGSGIESFEAHLYLARSLAGMKRPDRAAPHFEQAARRAPLARRGLDRLGRSASRDRWTRSGAARSFARAGDRIRGGAQLALARGGPVPSAAPARRSGRRLPGRRCRCCPAMPRSASSSASCSAISARSTRRSPRLRDAVAVDATNASAWNALGMTLGGSGRFERGGEGVSQGDRARRQAIIAITSISGSSSCARAAAARRGRRSNARCSSRPTSARRETSFASLPPNARGAHERCLVTVRLLQSRRSSGRSVRRRALIVAAPRRAAGRRLDRPRRLRPRPGCRAGASSQPAARLARHPPRRSSRQLRLRRRRRRRGSTRWRASGLRFEQATTVVPLTLPAHASLMTGTFPGWHGVRDNGGFYLDDDQLHAGRGPAATRAIRTGGFVGAFVLDRRWGIAQGFDRYFDDFDLDKFADAAAMDMIQRPGREVVDRALEWLRREPRRSRSSPGCTSTTRTRRTRRPRPCSRASREPETAPTTPRSRTPTRRSGGCVDALARRRPPRRTR